MKNKEKYVDDIIATTTKGYNIAVRRIDEEVVGCEETDCRYCVFLNGDCAKKRRKWLESEAKPTIDELKAELERVKKENAELRARLEKAVEPQFSNGDEVYAIMDTLFYTGVFPVTIKSADVVYEVFDGEQTTTQHRTRIFTTRAEAEARLKELQGGENGDV